jgi:uncharacterized small protein (DUF1192 family)
MEDDIRKRPSGITVGEDLSRLSVAELEARALALGEEIARTQAAIAEKRSGLSAAQALFGGTR